MAVLTLSQMRSFARRLVADTDTTNPGLADSDYTDLINEQYASWWYQFNDRVEFVSQLASVADSSREIKTGTGYRDIVALETYPLVDQDSYRRRVERLEVADARRLQETVAAAADAPTRAAWTRESGTDKWIIFPVPVLDLGTISGGSLLDCDLTNGSPSLAPGPGGDDALLMVGATLSNVNIPGNTVALSKDSLGVVMSANATATVSSQLVTFTNACLISGWVRKYPTVLSANGDTPDCGDAESRWLARLAAAQAALILGRSGDWTGAILQPVPDWFQTALTGSMKTKSQPVRPRGEPA